MGVVQALERRFLPHLNKMAEKLSKEFPAVKSSVGSGSVGAATDYQGHMLGVESFFPDAAPDEDDLVALTITVKHVTTRPWIDSVDVCWGQGKVEAEMFPEPVEMSEEVLQKIQEELPNLYEVLRAAVRRKKPRQEQ